MTTTIEALGSPANAHHRRGLALVVAAIIAVGGVGATVAIAADSDSSNPAPAQVTNSDSPVEDPLVSRFSQPSASASAPFSQQPLLRNSGAH